MSFNVIPAQAVIQYFQRVLDACLRRHDGIFNFYKFVEVRCSFLASL
jgi:hypothetical protein